MDGSVDYIAKLRHVGPIGDGAFGEVHQCVDPVHGDVAAKRFFQSKFGSHEAWDEACAAALQEARHLKALEHSHVVKLHQVLQTGDGDEFLIVMEYCEGRSARQITETNIVALQQGRRIIRDAAIGLNYIHENKYLHRDIKPDNILLKADGHVKVGDFGFVTDKLQFGFATPYGTAVYWAPEVLAEKACSALSDVYSLGATFINMISGDHWFFRQGRGQMIDVDEDGEPSLSKKMLFLPHVPQSWRSLASKMCRAEVGDRCQSLGAAVNSIIKLPTVEPWTCTVGDDQISWELIKDKRRVRVDWMNYLGRKGERWSAWTENLDGSKRRSLAVSTGTDKWKAIYTSLQKFFASRTVG